MKNEEGDPIFRIDHFGENKPITNERSRKNVLIDDKAPDAFKVRQFILLLKNKEGDPIVRINFGRANPSKIREAERMFLIEAPNAFNVRQFIVLLKTKEADTIFMNIFRRRKHIQNGETKENLF